MTFTLEHHTVRAHLGLPGTRTRDPRPISHEMMRDLMAVTPEGEGLGTVWINVGSAKGPRYRWHEDLDVIDAWFARATTWRASIPTKANDTSSAGATPTAGTAWWSSTRSAPRRPTRSSSKTSRGSASAGTSNNKSPTSSVKNALAHLSET